jgi:hypothetical protein
MAKGQQGRAEGVSISARYTYRVPQSGTVLVRDCMYHTIVDQHCVSTEWQDVRGSSALLYVCMQRWIG